MAFSLEQKNEIVFLLGYPAKTVIEGSNLYNSFIDDRLSDVDTFTQDRVESLLGEISGVRTKLTELQSQGKLRRVGDIEFNVDSNDRTVKSEYRRLIKELGCYLDIKPKMGGKMIGVCL